MRRRRSNWRVFGQGFMLAGIPVLAFAGTDYLFAPPSSGGGSDAAAILRNLTTGHRAADEGKAGAFAAPSMRQSAKAAAQKEEASGLPQSGRTGPQPANRVAAPQSGLVTSIQRELRRVGCYSGETDGTWTDRTRVAMSAFNESVHVNIGTNQPDFILLTLLQGHSGKACSRSCNNALAQAGAQCIDKTIEARRLPPASLASRQVAADRGGAATTSSASADALRLPAWSTGLNRGPGPGPVQGQNPSKQQGPGRETETVVSSVDAAQLPSTVEKLPGRMAVGALAVGAEEEPLSTVETAHSEQVPQLATPRPPAIARPSAPASTAKTRMSRTFFDITRNSP